MPGRDRRRRNDLHRPAASYPNFGSPNVFVSAPGSAIYSTIAGSTYATYNGTSMAAPHVAGLAALLRTQTPGLSVASLKTILATTSDKIGGVTYGADPYATCAGCTWSSAYGYGRINIDRALGGGAPASAAASAPAASPDTTAPTQPSGLGATPSGTSINLSWTASTDNVAVTGYDVERCQGTGCTAFTPLTTTATTSLVNSGLPTSTSYSYRVRAKDVVGMASAYSNTATATTAAPPPSSLTTAFPTAVTPVAGTATAGNAASLAAIDTSYYTVRSPFFSSASWYGTFTAPTNATDFKVDVHRTRVADVHALARHLPLDDGDVGDGRYIPIDRDLPGDDRRPGPVGNGTGLRPPQQHGSGTRPRHAAATTFSTYTSSGNMLQLSYRS